MVPRRGWVIAIPALIGVATGCRQLFGIDDTEVVAPADAAIDAGRGRPDAPVDASPTAIDASTQCPQNYVKPPNATSMYRVETETTAWLAAAKTCASEEVFGSTSHTHLVVLAEEAERSTVGGLVLSQAVWIGLSDRVNEGEFLGVTQEDTGGYPPTSGNPWAPGEPSGEDCVGLTPFAELTDVPCLDSRGYVCECDLFANDPGQY
jgi:hypothetical protein